MLGYIHNTAKLWYLWDPIQKSAINATNIRFDEDNNMAARKLSEGKVLPKLTADTTILLQPEAKCQLGREIIMGNTQPVSTNAPEQQPVSNTIKEIEIDNTDNASIQGEQTGPSIEDIIVVKPLSPKLSR